MLLVNRLTLFVPAVTVTSISYYSLFFHRSNTNSLYQSGSNRKLMSHKTFLLNGVQGNTKSLHKNYDTNTRLFLRSFTTLCDDSTIVMNKTKDNILQHSIDKYNGVIIKSTELVALSDEEFTDKLNLSLKFWKYYERRGIWLKIPIEKSSFIPIAVSNNFVFHHAEKEFVMLTNWLSEDENKLPPNASHQVGIGCVVIHNDKILLVQEKNGPLKGTGVWKLPTGLCDLGEDITAAAVREVYEETGVRAEFDRILCFRQLHNSLFGKSDLFFVCVLKPVTCELNPQESEILKCEWLDPDMLFEQPFFKTRTLMVKINSIIKSYIENPNQPHIVSGTFPIGFRPGANDLYFIQNGTANKEDVSK
eukprot:gene12498-16766_t